MDATLEDKFQLVHFHRLAEKVVGSRTDRLDRILPFSLTRDNDDFRGGIDREKFAQGSETFRRIVRPGRQPEVE